MKAQNDDLVEKQPRISVIIPARNEAEHLPATLHALWNQTYPSFEVIVIANGCQDGTEKVAQGLCDQLYVMPTASLGRARNLGAAKATGTMLLFLDADTILGEHALADIARKFTRKYAAGTLKGVPDKSRFAYKVIYAVKNALHASHIHCGSSGVILCWKDHFEAVGGFDQSLYLRENSDLIRRLLRYGRYLCIRSSTALTSMRRYDKEGALTMVALWFRVWLLSIFSDLHDRTYDELKASDRSSLRMRRSLRAQRHPI
jgi:glycosyltransferase involved in cell wall biosynthesis